LENREYANPKEFANDFRLVISNCKLYNPQNDPVVECAKKLQVG